MIWKDITTTPSYLPNLRINVGTQGQKFVWTVYYAPVIYRLWGSMQHVQDSHLWPQWLEAVHHWQMGKCMIKHHRRRYWSMEKAVICMQESERTSHWASSKLKRLFLEPPPYTTGSLQSRQQSTAETCYTLGQSCCCYLKTNKGSTLLKVCFLCTKNYQNLSVLVETTICQIWHIFWDRVQCLFLVLHFTVFVWCLSAFSALTLLVGGEEGHLTCKCLTPTKQLPKDSRGDFGRLTQLNRSQKYQQQQQQSTRQRSYRPRCKSICRELLWAVSVGVLCTLNLVYQFSRVLSTNQGYLYLNAGGTWVLNTFLIMTVIIAFRHSEFWSENNLKFVHLICVMQQ